MIQTRRLDLRIGTRESLFADLEGHDALAEALGVEVPENWPPEYYDEPAIQWTLDKLPFVDPQNAGYWLYYAVLRREEGPVLIGVAGFKWPPHEGSIEIGYGVLEQYRRQGFATEMVDAFVRFAFSHDDMHEVTAETYPELIASIGVLEKNGFQLVGPGSEEGVIRFALARAAWELLRP